MTDEALASRRTTEAAVGLGTLLLSAGTLICCALPILLVSLGLGASVAALTSAAPWLVSLSAHKNWVFTVSGLAIAGGVFLLYRPGRACPTDPRLAALCARADRWNRAALSIAAVIWSIGFTAAFLWLPMRRWLGV
jgi:mercuric ion transport protein